MNKIISSRSNSWSTLLRPRPLRTSAWLLMIIQPVIAPPPHFYTLTLPSEDEEKRQQQWTPVGPETGPPSTSASLSHTEKKLQEEQHQPEDLKIKWWLCFSLRRGNPETSHTIHYTQTQQRTCWYQRITRSPAGAPSERSVDPKQPPSRPRSAAAEMPGRHF